MALAWRAFLVWLGLFVLAFVNGALREVVMKKALAVQEPLAHQLSVGTGITLWTIFTASLWHWLAIPSLAASLVVGLCWLLGTMLVETFVLQRNLAWEQILHSYNVAEGELWGLVVLWIGLMPPLFFLFLH